MESSAESDSQKCPDRPGEGRDSSARGPPVLTIETVRSLKGLDGSFDNEAVRTLFYSAMDPVEPKQD